MKIFSPNFAFCGSVIPFLLSGAALPAAPAAVKAPTPVCPARAELKLNQVVAEIQSKVPADHIATLIGACHVSFAMDPAAVERLSAAGAAGVVLEALDRDTISRMRNAQAHAEVEALESRKRTNEASAAGQRDQALLRIDAEFKARRDKAAVARPRGEFELTADYNIYLQRQSENMADMDRTHEADRTRLAEKYAADAAAKNRALDRRIAALKNGLYLTAGTQPAYIGYNPDNSRLAASLSGVEFWFIADPRQAQSLKEHWSSIKVLERYEDKGDGADALFLGSTVAGPVRGIPRATVEAKEEAERIAAAERKAKEEKRAAELLRQRQEFTASPKMIAGAWYDAATGLLWTEKDNGKDVNFVAAASYCKALSVGNFSDWRLATVNELRTLYDPAKLRRKTSFGKIRDAGGRGMTTYGTRTHFYHIKGDISLSNTIVWSGTAQGSNQAWMVSFEVGGQQAFDFDTIDGRALCTRSLTADSRVR
jgi:hypothetical protein